MAKQLKSMRKKLQKAVKYVNEKKDSEYQSLMAKQLVDMETYVFVGYLMLRDALKDQEREALAEKFILNAVPEIESSYMLVMSGDTTTIDRHSEIIGY